MPPRRSPAEVSTPTAAGAAGAAAAATPGSAVRAGASSVISAPVTGAIDPSAARDDGRDRTLRMAGYADFKYQRFDDYPNAQSTTSKKRGRTDLSRFILAPLVAAGEHSFAPGVKLGGSFYTGDSAANRPRDNLAASARVTLGTLYGRYEVGPWTLRGQALVGRIENAAAITRANPNTFNGSVLGTSRTPVGSRAKSFFVEAGYDLFSIAGRSGAQRLDLFARYDNYDTHAATEGTIVRNGAYARKAMTVGLNYKPRPGIVLKAEYSHRTNDGAVANKQDFLGVGAGFEF